MNTQYSMWISAWKAIVKVCSVWLNAFLVICLVCQKGMDILDSTIIKLVFLKNMYSGTQSAEYQPPGGWAKGLKLAVGCKGKCLKKICEICMGEKTEARGECDCRCAVPSGRKAHSRECEASRDQDRTLENDALSPPFLWKSGSRLSCFNTKLSITQNPEYPTGWNSYGRIICWFLHLPHH